MNSYNKVVLLVVVVLASVLQKTHSKSIVYRNRPSQCQQQQYHRNRKACGSTAITAYGCHTLGCCYQANNKPGQPKCFKVPSTKKEPEWMTKLLQMMSMIEKKNPFTVPMTTTTPQLTTTTPSVIEREVQDEIMCQKTYKIYLEVKGAEKCSAPGHERMACKIVKKPGVSECTACTKIGCCYDATLKAANGFNFIPRCYKTKKKISTTQAPTYTSNNNWLTNRPTNVVPTNFPPTQVFPTSSNNILSHFTTPIPTSSHPFATAQNMKDLLSMFLGNGPATNVHVPKYEKLDVKIPEKLCYPKQCGYRVTDGEVRASQRIVGGQWSGGIQYWPWMASVRRNFTDDWRYRHICGATIISNNWILTAGHCFTKYTERSRKFPGEREVDMKIFAITMGNYFRDEAQRSMQVRMLKQYHSHPKYDYESLSYDIAVARFTEPVKFTDYIQPACIPNRVDTIEVGSVAWVTGWGETYNIGQHDKSKLKELPLPLVSNNECKQYWKEFYHPSWICTEGAYLEDACAGDSGGPLVHRDSDKRWDIIGVAIAGTKRCSTDPNDIRPGIYSNIAYYRDFIDSFTNGAC